MPLNSDQLIEQLAKLLGLEKLDKHFQIDKLEVKLEKGKPVHFNVGFVQQKGD